MTDRHSQPEADRRRTRAAAPIGAVRRGRGGFTLSEILVVITIIVIVATLTVPVFNVLSGSRSIDGASNTIGAMLARARQEAISRQRPIGLAVFTDTVRDRVAVALVSSPLPWQPDTTYVRGDVVSVVSTLETDPRGAPARTYFYVCHTTHTSATSMNDPFSPDRMPRSTSPGTIRWNFLRAGSPHNPDAPLLTESPPRRYGLPSYVSIVPGTDIMYLPRGVGAQVLVSARTTTGGQLDRYLHAGVIFFGPDGRLMPEQTWGVLFNGVDLPDATNQDLTSSRLGMLIRFDSNPASSADSTNIDPVPSLTSDRLRGGLGVILFDRQAYLSQGFPLWDAMLDPSRSFDAGTPSERTKETWLDANGTLLLVNRFNGTLLRAE